VSAVLSPGVPEVHVKNPALLELDPELRQAYGAMLLSLADSELVIGHRNSEWTGFGPSAEEDVAFSSIAQDEMGHAHLYYAIVAGADDEDAVDRLALDRGPRALRHVRVLHAPNGDWFFTIARHLYWETFEETLLTAAKQSDLPVLAGAAERILNEELYHQDHAAEWLKLLSGRAPQRRRLVRQMTRVAALGGNPMLAIDGLDQLGHRGHLPDVRDLASAYRASLRRRLAAAPGWQRADVDAVTVGLRGTPATLRAAPGLYRLHHDLTGLRRAHAGASW
jgi:ring-1,2-phenylacetyl-CoA epoxidase subunit PaaC